MTMNKLIGLFLSFCVLSGCASVTNKNVHADEWIKVNKLKGE